MTTRDRRPHERQGALALATLLASASLPAIADAQAAPTAPAQTAQPSPSTTPEPATLEEVTVTGTLISGLQTELPIPTTTITAEQILERGYVSVADALKRSSFSTGYLQSQSQGFTQGAQTASLFGFGPGFTKYLIDGRPAVSYPALYSSQAMFVDTSALPSALISRIEILPGGQSSLYGSDAVSGVINVELKKTLDGPSLEARYGFYERGGGESLRLSYADGFKAGRLSVIGGVQYDRSKPIWGFDRELTRANFAGGTSPAEALIVAAVEDANFTTYAPPPGACARMSELNGGTTIEASAENYGSYCGHNRAVRTLTNDEERAQIYLRATYDLGGGAELYGDLLYNDSTANYIYAPTPLSYFSDYYYSNALGGAYSLSRRFAPEEVGGLDNLLSSDKLKSLSASVGVKGEFGGDWSYDVSAKYARQELAMKRRSYLSAPLQAYVDGLTGADLGEFDDPVLGPIRIRELDLNAYFSPVSPEQGQSLIGDLRANAETELTWGRALVSNAHLFALPGGDAGIAFGVEGQKESWRYDPDPLLNTGAFYNNFADVTGPGDPSYTAALSEIRLPVTDRVTLSGSLRYDRYVTEGEDTGQASWNIAAEARPINRVTVRARYGTAFKPPTLADLYQGDQIYQSSALDYLRCTQAGYAIDDVSACPFQDVYFRVTRRGDTALKPLTADVLDLGFTVRPLEGLRLDLDYLTWDIENGVRPEDVDAILRREAQCSQGQGDPALCSANAALITRDANGVLTGVITNNRNLAVESAAALVFAGGYSRDLGGAGSIDFDVSYNYMLDHTRRERPETEEIDLIKDPIYDTSPRSKANAYATWSRERLGVTLGVEWVDKTPNYVASFAGYDAPNAGKLSSWTTYSLSARYDVTDTVRASIAVNNLFDSDPPIDRSVPGFTSSPYASGVTNVDGRQFLLQVNAQF